MLITEKEADIRAPSGRSGPTRPQRLAGSSGEARTTEALKAGQMATLLVGPAEEGIRVEFYGSQPPSSGAVDTTDLWLPKGGRIDWYVQEDTDSWVAIESGDGSTDYEAWVWTSSGPRAAAEVGRLLGSARGRASVAGTLDDVVLHLEGAVDDAAATVAGDLVAVDILLIDGAALGTSSADATGMVDAAP